jgi:hypothetical protein
VLLASLHLSMKNMNNNHKEPKNNQQTVKETDTTSQRIPIRTNHQVARSHNSVFEIVPELWKT